MKQNRKAFIQLALMGYPRDRVRRAMVELTGITQQQIAAAAGVSRQSVNAAMVGRRKNPKVQETLSAMWEVPQDELFADVA